MSTLILALCLTYSKSNHDNKQAPPIALTSYLKVEPSFFYYNNNLFHATVMGQLKLDIRIERFADDITNYDTLVIADYQYDLNTHLSLNWKVNGEPHKALINQSKNSINHIDFQTKDIREISDLHLMITSMHELGLEKNFQSQISFQSMHLDNRGNQSQIATNLSEWSNFIPVKLSAINGYTNASNLHFKSLILRLSCWLVAAILIFWLCKIKGTHLIATFFLAWLTSSYFFLTNHFLQHNQISQAFPPEQKIINRLDQESHDLARHIKTTFKSNSTILSSTDRLVLIGANTFYKLRLKHHLSNFNIAINYDLQNLLNNQVNNNSLYLLTENELPLCNNQPENEWLIKQINFIHVDSNFCLMRKK